MKQFKRISNPLKTVKVVILLGLMVSLPLLCSACKLYTVVKLENQSQRQGIKVYFENNNFNAAEYVDSIWENRVVPYTVKKALDIGLVLKEISANPDEVGAKYGYRDASEGIPWNFIVKGTGRILVVNTASRAGTIEIDLPPYDGRKDLIIQIGPVIKGSSIRDSLEFISFDDFGNQIEFAQLGNAFNKEVYDRILSKIQFATMKGKEIEFICTFTAEDSSEILGTPVVMKIH